MPRERCLRLQAVLLLMALAGGDAAWAADSDEIAELKRAIAELRAQNRALAERVETLESQQSIGSQAAAAAASGPGSGRPQPPPLEQRVRQLETTQAAQEGAVRQIIHDSVSTLGSKINEAVSLNGTISVAAERSSDLDGQRKSSLKLNTAEFEFDIQASDWARAAITLEYISGEDLLFPTSSGFQSGVDRVNVDTAFITLGDAQRFPPVLMAGRMVLPFGISTGKALGDSLSLNSPLTVEIFEMRQDALGLTFSFPTPPLAPPLPPVTAPPVRPMLLQPLVASLSRRLGYEPLAVRPKPLLPQTPAAEAPPFHAGLYVFDTRAGGGLRHQYGATLGYQAKGHCGRRYEELSDGGLCPWRLSLGLDYNSSIFHSRLLEFEYQGLLDRIGHVPATALHARASLGAWALTGEWDSATRTARFDDDRGAPVGLRPSAWQLSLGYQLGWNPWVEEIGAQGSYLAIGYSQSRDMAGLSRVVDGSATRFGFVPRRRLLLTAGEWVMENVRVVVEYSRNWDYALADGGSGQVANGLFVSLSYAW